MYVAITGKGKSRVIQFCEQHRIAKTNKKKDGSYKNDRKLWNTFKREPKYYFWIKRGSKKK